MRAIFVLLCATFGFLSPRVVIASGSEIDPARVEEMRVKICSLGADETFTYIDLGLTEDELALVEKLDFQRLDPESHRDYSCFGVQNLSEELPIFLRAIGNDDEAVIQVVTKTIVRLAAEAIKSSGKESAWVFVRASTPNHEFDVPLLHADGQYYDFNGQPYPGIVFKLAAVLKGPATLLYTLSAEQRKILGAHWNDRAFLSEMLDLSAAESAKRGEGVLFVVADSDSGGIHTVPKITENRFFFSIVAGDVRQIQEMEIRWHSPDAKF